MAEDISNKTLAVLVGLAIVVSLAGIMFAPRGFITGAGVVNPREANATIDILGYLGVDVVDGTESIHFGNVTLSGVSTEWCAIDSNATTPTGVGVGCVNSASDFTARDYFQLNNTGQGNVNVTIKTDVTKLATGGANSLLFYQIAGGTCDGSVSQVTYNEFAAAITEYPLCSNLTEATVLDISLKINMTGDNNDEAVAVITFTARESQG